MPGRDVRPSIRGRQSGAPTLADLPGDSATVFIDTEFKGSLKDLPGHAEVYGGFGYWIRRSQGMASFE